MENKQSRIMKLEDKIYEYNNIKKEINRDEDDNQYMDNKAEEILEEQRYRLKDSNIQCLLDSNIEELQEARVNRQYFISDLEDSIKKEQYKLDREIEDIWNEKEEDMQ